MGSAKELREKIKDFYKKYIYIFRGFQES